MASLEFWGYNEQLAAFDEMDAGLQQRIRRALELSAGVLADQLKAEGANTFKEPTGELEGKVKPGPMTLDRLSSFIEVWAQGSYTGVRGRPRRAETVAFVLEYGREDMPANPWNARAVDKSEMPIRRFMQEIIESM